MSVFIIEKKPRLFNIHMVHTPECELLPAGNDKVKKITGDTMQQALVKAGSYFEKVRACAVCAVKEDELIYKRTNIENAGTRDSATDNAVLQ